MKSILPWERETFDDHMGYTKLSLPFAAVAHFAARMIAKFRPEKDAEQAGVAAEEGEMHW